MTITIDMPSGDRHEFENSPITIGRNPDCDISFAGDDRLEGEHAVLRKVADRWMVEARGDHSIQIGDAKPVRMAWLDPGDQIRLTENGPTLQVDLAASKSTLGNRIAATTTAVNDNPTPQPETADSSMKTVQTKKLVSDAPLKPDAIPNQTRALIIVVCVLLFGGIPIIVFVAAIGLYIAAASRPPAEQMQFPVTTVATSPLVEETAESHDVEFAPTTDEAEESIRESIFLVVLQNPEQGQIYQLGTACAVSETRLVTSAAVAQAIRDLQKELPIAKVICPATGTEMVITQSHVHTTYQTDAASLKQLATQLTQLQAELAQADAKSKEKLVEQAVNAEESLLQTLEHQVFADLAFLEVDGRLESTIKIRRAEKPLAMGSTLQLWGTAFSGEDYLVDPENLPKIQTTSGKLALRIELNQRHRLLVKFQLADGLNWSGSAVIDSSGRIVGIYSRPTPPPIDTRDQPFEVESHDVVDIESLDEIEF